MAKKIKVENVTLMKDKTELEKLELENKIRHEQKMKDKAIADQVLRFIGVLTSIFLFIVVFSMISHLTVFSFVNGGRSAILNWDAIIQRGSIVHNMFWGGKMIMVDGVETYIEVYNAAVFSIVMMTMIQVALAVLLGFLIAYYIRDAIGVVKNILKLGKDITVELATSVKESVTEGIVARKEKREEENKQIIERAKKKIIDAKPENIEPEAPKKADVIIPEEDLDKALTDPNYKPPVKTDSSSAVKKLFDSKK